MTRGEYNVNNDEDPSPARKRTNGNAFQEASENKVEAIEIESSKEKPYVGYGFKEVKIGI